MDGWSLADAIVDVPPFFSKKKKKISARYWKDPHTFNPSRFLADWPRDAFVPFSAGEKSPPLSPQNCALPL